jgi:hypothetical protein
MSALLGAVWGALEFVVERNSRKVGPIGMTVQDIAGTARGVINISLDVRIGEYAISKPIDRTGSSRAAARLPFVIAFIVLISFYFNFLIKLRIFFGI